MCGPRAIAVFLFLLCTVDPARAGEEIELRVMTFNVWYGGEEVSLERIGEAIRRADADIVGLQESDRNLERIAREAGMAFVDPRRRIASRFPIFDSGAGVRTETGTSPYSTTGLDRNALHAWVMVRPGRVVAMANVHLSNSPSGLGTARRGGSAGEVLGIERRSRVVEAEPLAALGALGNNGTPVFLTGDFNTASHLDWTEATRRARDDVPYPLDWPVTRLLADAGLKDSYRERYPDPVVDPGYTWTPGAPHPLADHERARDRIDYILTAGNSRTLASQIVGEPGGPGVDIAVSPWPSDHRAVVSTFSVDPVTAPPMIAATPRRVMQDGVIHLRTWDPAGDTWTALVTRRGGTPRDALAGIREMPHDYQRSIPLSLLGFGPGDYDAILVGENGDVIARNGFTIVADGARPHIESVDPVVSAGDPVRVRWKNAPGDLRDWVGVYRAGETDVSLYLAFAYTEASFDGELVLPAESLAGLGPGDYELRLLHDETYVVLARAPLTIRP